MALNPSPNLVLTVPCSLLQSLVPQSPGLQTQGEEQTDCLLEGTQWGARGTEAQGQRFDCVYFNHMAVSPASFILPSTPYSSCCRVCWRLAGKDWILQDSPSAGHHWLQYSDWNHSLAVDGDVQNGFQIASRELG